MSKPAAWPEGWTVVRKPRRWLVTWRVGDVDRLKQWFDMPPDRPPTPADVLADQKASTASRRAFQESVEQSLRPRRGGR